ncbi:hypothetical protein CB1_000309020 [Camelus ferus]|nr:hypothetical protein CB1_000309020 [Camelus ferus]
MVRPLLDLPAPPPRVSPTLLVTCEARQLSLGFTFGDGGYSHRFLLSTQYLSFLQLEVFYQDYGTSTKLLELRAAAFSYGLCDETTCLHNSTRFPSRPMRVCVQAPSRGQTLNPPA